MMTSAGRNVPLAYPFYQFLAVLHVLQWSLTWLYLLFKLICRSQQQPVSLREKTQYLTSMAMLMQTMSMERPSSDSERCLRVRDPSFSSYLSGNEECYVINLAKQSFGAGDGEIGVFSAEKYFNERLDDQKPEVGEKGGIRFPPVQDLVSCVKPKTQTGALSVRSVSSWNSQGALLAHRNPSLNGASRVRGRSYLGGFRCRCVCSDKDSVAVDEYQSCGEILTQSAAKGSKRETYSTSKDLSVEDLLMLPRKSLDVFGSPLLERRNKFFSFGFPRAAEAVIPIMAVGADAESDSDASSDLFEIENLTGKVNPFLSRNICGSATPTAAYAPSEASIEWSVVTDSVADFPITSDYDEVRSGKNITNSKKGSTGMNQKTTATSDKPRRFFLACNSQDSVKVVNYAHTTYEKKPETKILKSQESPAQVYRAQTEAKLTAFETARNMRLGISSRSLAQSNSLHDSNMLYFQ